MPGFSNLPHDVRLKTLIDIEVLDGTCSGYLSNGRVQFAMPNDPANCDAIHRILKDLGFERTDMHYFPLGSDAPPEILRWNGPYQTSNDRPGYWMYWTFKPVSNGSDDLQQSSH
jgi:hypothetical protein